MIWILHHKTYKLGKKDLITFCAFLTEMNGFKGFLLNNFVIFFLMKISFTLTSDKYWIVS